mgnify:FL=1
MNNINYRKLGEKVKQKRRESGYTQEKLAEMCDISTGFLGHIESGTRTPSLETLYSIACALHSGVDYFLFDSAVDSDNILEQIGSVVRSKKPHVYKHFCNTVKILAEHIDEI